MQNAIHEFFASHWNEFEKMFKASSTPPSNQGLVEEKCDVPIEEKCDVPSENECINENVVNGVKSEMVELKQECPTSCGEVSDLSVVVQDEGTSTRVYCTNALNFALSSIFCFTQVEQGQVTLVMHCSILKSLVQFASLHRIYLIGVKPIWSRFVQAIEFKSDQVHGKDTQAEVKVENPISIAHFKLLQITILMAEFLATNVFEQTCILTTLIEKEGNNQRKDCII